MRKKIIAAILCLGLFTGIFAVSTDSIFATDDKKNIEVQTKTRELYRMHNMGNYSEFSNYVHGYSLFIDQGMKVEMSYSDVCAVLENDQKRIEIYKECLPANVSQQAFMNYSNKFIENTVDHTKEFESRRVINGRAVHILQWSREKLSKVENDKNYYVSIEILSGARVVYTILVKADRPFYMNGGYNYLINDFKTFASTKAAYMRQAQPVPLKDKGWNQETQDYYNEFFGPDSTLKWGLFQPKAPDDFTQMNWLEEKMEYEFPILLNYTNVNNLYGHPDLHARLENTYKQNKTLVLTLQTIQTEDGGNMVYDILDGEYDDFLKDYAKTISDFGHPVLFRLGNEMNGDWCPYSSYHISKDTMIFKEFYRYVYNLFDEAGAENVIWVWNPNGQSFPDFQWNSAVMYYPGDEYVDIVGLTAYNTGTYYPDEKWTEFDVLYDSLYLEYMDLYQHPFMIPEFASSSVGGDKEQWIRNMFAHIGNYENVKVAIWWDGCDWDAEGNVARPYFIDETPVIIQVFKEFLNKKPRFWDVYG